MASWPSGDPREIASRFVNQSCRLDGKRVMSLAHARRHQDGRHETRSSSHG